MFDSCQSRCDAPTRVVGEFAMRRPPEDGRLGAAPLAHVTLSSRATPLHAGRGAFSTWLTFFHPQPLIHSHAQSPSATPLNEQSCAPSSGTHQIIIGGRVSFPGGVDAGSRVNPSPPCMNPASASGAHSSNTDTSKQGQRTQWTPPALLHPWRQFSCYDRGCWPGPKTSLSYTCRPWRP